MKPGQARKYLEKTRADYNLIASEFSQTRFLPWEEMIQLSDKYVHAGANVLDVGCGNGRLFEALKTRQANYIGIDFSAKLLDQARRKFPGVTFMRGDAMDLNAVDDKSMDVVFLVAVLQHLPSWQFQLKALKEAQRVLKPGGYLVMENWNMLQRRYWRHWLAKYWVDSELPWQDLLIPWKGNDAARQQKPVWRYYHAFMPRELTNLVEKSGFKLVEQYYVKKGQKVNRWSGYNIVTVAKK